MKPRLLVLAVSAVLAAAVAPPAQAAYPGLNGRIAFTDYKADPEPLLSINPNGTGLTPLTSGQSSGAYDIQPSYSPDGKRIAFHRHIGSTDQVWVMNADGSGAHNISNDAFKEFSPTWSPDGQTIAFNRQGPGSQVYVMHADGSGKVNISNNTSVDARPRWSPDGKTLLFVRQPSAQSGGGQIWAMNSDGSNQHALTDNDPTVSAYAGPDWSPDSKHIVFNRDVSGTDGNNHALSSLWVMNADGSNQHKISNNPNDYLYGPAWSPDGKQIAFTNDIDNGAGHIWAMNADGSGQHAVTTDASERYFRPEWQPLSNLKSSAAVPACTKTGAIAVTVSDPSGFLSRRTGVRFTLDGGGVQAAPTAGDVATIHVPEGKHTLVYWGQNQAGDQEATHHTASVVVDRHKPKLSIRSNQHRKRYHRGDKVTVKIKAKDLISGLAKNPSKKKKHASSKKLGIHKVKATAVDKCGNTAHRSFHYRVKR